MADGNEHVQALLKSCEGLSVSLEGGQVDVDAYLQAYEALSAFLSELGSVFGFVTDDINKKIGILRGEKEARGTEHFATIEAMMEFEVADNNTRGSRNLLRLHRALEFIVLFLTRFVDSADSDSPSHLASTSYHETLAHHHKWLVRKAVGVALYTLPNHASLSKRIFSDEVTKADVRVGLGSLKRAYDLSEALYTKHELGNLK